MTPKRKTEKELQNFKFTTPRSRKAVKRRLLLANCLEHELSEAKKHNTKKHVRSLVNIVSGKVVKKYRGVRYIASRTGINRRTLLTASSKNIMHVREIKWKTRLALQQDVVAFYERDDNCRCMPGKNDLVGKSQLQKRVLNDYLANLFLKFGAEFLNVKLSLSSFCKLRPAHVLPVSFTARNTCLCSKHQNMALKLKSLKSFNVVSTSSPDAFIKAHTQSEIERQLSQIQLDKVTYKTWKKVTDSRGKSKMKLVDEEVAKDDFISNFLSQCTQFREHVARVQTQYAQLRFLKGNLPDSHVIIQMDFAENYLCQCLDEIQSAYWNATMVTLHPAVVYFKNNGVLYFGTVYTILQSLLPEVKELVPYLSYVHYWTDSPSSQYRNKTAFNYVLQHPEVFGVRASWHYIECGHGKGPCDGLGGTAKRMADSAVKQGKFNIQSAHDFYVWATGQPSSVVYIFSSKEDCDSNQKRLEQWGVKPVKGTMTIHAVYEAEGCLMVKETSCFCDGCFASDGFLSVPSCPWQRKVLVTNPAPDDNEENAPQPENVQVDEEVLPTQSEANVVQDPTCEISINVDAAIVAAIYEFDNKVYFGKVLDIDEQRTVKSVLLRPLEKPVTTNGHEVRTVKPFG
ncbi:uncharacterized protein LOC124254795 [Haliotis rubra]|uniref:uncharacterized protein LOC124254795 n=1 Tax=Haliotis rubra TaxID=36100 RepID=UPI001EE58CF5|nr:uncharacterized protein LOC124254795 [Haliotis rubra]